MGIQSSVPWCREVWLPYPLDHNAPLKTKSFFQGSKIPIRHETSPKKVVGSNNNTENVAKKVSTGSNSDSPDSTSKNVETPKDGSESPKKLLLSPKKSGPPKPWLSPKMFRARLPSKEQRSRSLSVDNNIHQKVGLKPLQNRKRAGLEQGDQMFLMEDDGEGSAASTSDSEVVVVVNQIRKSQIKEREKKPNKVAVNNRRKLTTNNEDERVSFAFFGRVFPCILVIRCTSNLDIWDGKDT